MRPSVVYPMSPVSPHRPLLWFLAALLAGGCAGEVGGDGRRADPDEGDAPLTPAGGGGPRGPATPVAPGSAGGSGGTAPAPAPGKDPAPDGPPAAVGNACRASLVGASPLRRLTAFEYDNAVRDLLGTRSRPGESFPAEVGGNGFGNDATALGFSRLLVESHFKAADGLATEVLATPAAFEKTVGCAPSPMDETACIRGFVSGFGRRAYRRPLEPAETDRLLALFRAARADGDFKSAAGTVLRTILQAPQFLYRVERGAGPPGPGGAVRLTPYEIATRLSFLLWASVPDEALLEAAAAGRLGTKDELLTQARRLLADKRAREVTAYFHRILFRRVGLEGLSKDKAVAPRWVPGTGARLAEEADRFVEHVLFEDAGTFGALLTAPYTFLNAELAKYYGVTGPKGDAFEKVTLDPAKGGGIMTQAGLLALLSPGAGTNPVKRGVFIREHLLCDPPPSPPASLMVAAPPPDKTKSTRESFAAHSADPACRGCHVLLDPLGFAFEGFDSAGLPRTTENGKPIDPSGVLEGSDVAGPFKGPMDLMRKVAGSAQAHRCYVGHLFAYASGRGETDEDHCAVDALAARFAEKKGDVRELLLALVAQDAFVHRQGETP